MTIVAISRDMGSGGSEIGAAVAKALNYGYMNREGLLEAAQTYGAPEAKLAETLDRHLTVWSRLDAERQRYLVCLEAAYYEFAAQDSVVTASRSGPFFVRDVGHALKVRITAPFEVRVRRIRDQEQVEEKAAAAKVRAYDREMAGRIQYLFGVDWTRPEYYDLVLTTGTDAWDFYKDLLVAAARHPRYQPTPESRQRILDLHLTAQVRAALASEPRTRHTSLDVSAQAGQVLLRGVVFSPPTLEAAAAVAREVPGVTGVVCQTVEFPAVYPGPIM